MRFLLLLVCSAHSLTIPHARRAVGTAALARLQRTTANLQRIGRPFACADPQSPPAASGPAARLKLATSCAVVGGAGLLWVGQHDPLLIAVQVLRKALKLGWRLVALGILINLGMRAVGVLFKAGFAVMLAGGPICAAKSAFFRGLSRAFDGLASICYGRGPLDSAGRFFDALACGCDDRAGGGAGMEGLFGGGGGGGSPFGQGDPFGADAAAGLFGGGVADPSGSPFGGPSTFGAADPPAPFPTSFKSGGMTINVRAPGAARADGGDSAAPATGGSGPSAESAGGEVIDAEAE